MHFGVECAIQKRGWLMIKNVCQSGLIVLKKIVDEDYYLIDKTLMIKIGIKILSGLLFYAT